MRDRWQVSDTRATFKHTRLKARALDELLALVGRVHIAHGAPHGRRGGLAHPGQLHQELGVRAMGQACTSLVEPELCFPQGIAQVACQGGALERVEAHGGLEPKAGRRQGIEAVEGLRAPLSAALARLLLC